MSMSKKIINNRKKINIGKYLINTVQILVLISCLAIVYVFSNSILNLIDQSTNTSDYKSKDVSDYFNKKTINTLIDIDNKKDTTLTTPQGRTNPFQNYKD